MKRFIVLSCAAALLLAQAAFAQNVLFPGLDLSWESCVLEGPRNNQNFDCARDTIYKLYGCFKVPTQIDGFVAAECMLDIKVDGPGGLPPFWHLETAACNNGALLVRHDKDEFGRCNDEASPWGDVGAEAMSSITSITPGAGGNSNRVRLILSIARLEQNPTTLLAYTNYYAFHLLLRTKHASECPGCGAGVAIEWLTASLYNNQGRPYDVLQGVDKATNCAQINSMCSCCIGDAARNTTWGQLKSMYR